MTIRKKFQKQQQRQRQRQRNDNDDKINEEINDSRLENWASRERVRNGAVAWYVSKSW